MKEIIISSVSWEGILVGAFSLHYLFFTATFMFLDLLPYKDNVDVASLDVCCFFFNLKKVILEEGQLRDRIKENNLLETFIASAPMTD